MPTCFPTSFNDTRSNLAAPLVFVPEEEVLDLLDADDVHRGLRQTLVEEALDFLKGQRAGRYVHQRVVLSENGRPHWRIPDGELLQRVHAEVGGWRIANGLGRVALDSRPVCEKGMKT